MNHRDPAVRKNYDHTNRVLPFSPGHSRVNRLGSARLGSFARSRVRACFRPTLEKLSLLRLTVPSANFLLPSTCSRFTRPLSGSQFSHGCPGRDRACVMSECTRHEVEFRVFFERWMERSLLENWPFRKLPPEYLPSSSLFRSSLKLVLVSAHRSDNSIHSQLVVDSWRSRIGCWSTDSTEVTRHFFSFERNSGTRSGKERKGKEICRESY